MSGKKTPDFLSAAARFITDSKGAHPLEQEYLATQDLGTLQTRAATLRAALTPENGAFLLDAAAKPGRHCVQLIKRFIKENIGLVRDFFYDPARGTGALPLFGRGSKIAAEHAKDSVISPEFARAIKLS
jgi:hypothetical protein